ncbi:hypothetical protein HRbin29_01129 [bacterium HR29]|jgi:hypothetical protein|nr:hypothetical protein HRbin29_01129 [bacterium HR29]
MTDLTTAPGQEALVWSGGSVVVVSLRGNAPAESLAAARERIEALRAEAPRTGILFILDGLVEPEAVADLLDPARWEGAGLRVAYAVSSEEQLAYLEERIVGRPYAAVFGDGALAYGFAATTG